jgi:hypothetical protein
VADQLIFQFSPSILSFWSNVYMLDEDEAVFTEYEKQLCAKYCTEWFPNPVVRIVPCEESTSCCKTDIEWSKSDEGVWTPNSITSEVIGECSGPSPKCKSGSRLDGSFSTLPLGSQCEPRACFTNIFIDL